MVHHIVDDQQPNKELPIAYKYIIQFEFFPDYAGLNLYENHDTLNFQRQPIQFD